MNKNAAVPATRHNVRNTHTIASNIHHNTLKSPRDARGQDLRVSLIRALSATE